MRGFVYALGLCQEPKIIFHFSIFIMHFFRFYWSFIGQFTINCLQHLYCIHTELKVGTLTCTEILNSDY